jgi:hypothetical protein
VDHRRTPHRLSVLFLATALAVARFAAASPAGAIAPEPAPTAVDGAEHGVLQFRITDESGRPLPARLTFLDEDGSRPTLFDNPDADPTDLALRANIVYSLSGENAITVPRGRYQVIVSRGMEYGIETRSIRIEPGRSVQLSATLRREIDTAGWISGDYHLHTLTHSGHGDSNMPERIISIVGEGLEFAVATDHNHNTDYAPTIHSLGASPLLTAVTGNEISTPVGHFNAFPLEPDDALLPFRTPSAVPLFTMIRERTNRWRVVPVIQVNHPRWGTINYFGQAGLDPILGTTDSDVWSADFDTVEIFNENECWGYYDPDETDLEVDSNSHSVLRDWFNLLNRGHRIAAVGNSDSHDVASEIAAIPRNYTPSSTDDPASIDVAEVAGMLRDRRVFTTTGPFVEFSVDGSPMGSEIAAATILNAAASVSVQIRVQAASWIDVSRVKVVVNGEIVETIEVAPSAGRVRLETTRTLSLNHDAWVSVLVEGDRSMAPVMHDQGRTILPLAVTNPVWVDADADGRWVGPWDRAEAFIASRARANMRQIWANWAVMGPTDRSLLIQAAAAADAGFATGLIEAGLRDPSRQVRLVAVRSARTMGDATLLPALDAATETSDGDGLMCLELMLANSELSGDDRMAERVIGMLRDDTTGLVRRFGHELTAMVKGRFVDRWLVAGYFDCPTPDDIVTLRYPPEDHPEPGSVFETRAGLSTWTPISAGPDGFIDLAAVQRGSHDRAVAYLQTWITSPDQREATFTLGSDDSGMVWLNDELIYSEVVSRGADPLQHVGTLRLRPGANRVLFKVQNGSGGFGAYFRLLGEDLEFSPERRTTLLQD